MTQDPGSGAPMSERMQSLLSRAVEDQRTEQRSLDGALAEIRTQIGELSESLAHGQGNPSGSPDPASLASLSAEIREGLRRTGDRVDTVSRMVAQRGEDILGLQASLSALSEQMRGQTEGLNGALSTVVQRVEGISTYLADRSAGENSRSAALEQRLVALQTDMTALGSYVAGFAESASAAGAGNGELDARIRAIVGGALVGTERRLAAHLEETVLALAEALLRPRGPGDGADPPGDGESPGMIEEPAEPSPERLSPTASEGLSPTAPEGLSLTAPEGPGPVPVSSPPPSGAAPPGDTAADSADDAPPSAPSQAPAEAPRAAPQAPAAVAPAGRLTATASASPAPTGQQSHDAAPRVPPPWTTIDTDDERRRGWFRSRD